MQNAFAVGWGARGVIVGQTRVNGFMRVIRLASCMRDPNQNLPDDNVGRMDKCFSIDAGAGRFASGCVDFCGFVKDYGRLTLLDGYLGAAEMILRATERTSGSKACYDCWPRPPARELRCRRRRWIRKVLIFLDLDNALKESCF